METTIRRGDDFHTHLREGEMLKKVSPFSNLWGRITAMGNLSKPVATAHDVIKYRNKILQLNPKFIPIMSAMLVNSTTPEILRKTFEAGAFDNYGSLSELENFISISGAEFYNLPLNKDFITLRRQKWTVPKNYNGIAPFMAGHELEWKVEQ